MAKRKMGSGTSLATRNSRSPVHVHSSTPSTGAGVNQLQTTIGDSRSLLRLGSTDIPGGSVAVGQRSPCGQTSSRSASTQPGLSSQGSSRSENEIEERCNLPTPPLVNIIRSQSTRCLVGKCIKTLEKGFGLGLRQEELLRSVQEVRRGHGEEILTREEPASGVFIILDGELEVMAPEGDAVLCR